MELETTRKFIQTKLDKGVRPSLDSMHRKIRVTGVGPDPTDRHNPHTIVKLFQERERWLVWAQDANDEEIFRRIHMLQNKLSDDEVACKYNDCSFLSQEAYQSIVFIEDMEIALGIHPGCGPIGVKSPKDE